MRILLVLTLSIACFGLSGCYEDSSDVTLHETKGDSHYAGKPDDSVATRERQDTLDKRFKMVQTDR